jgi:GTP pyrophosphokinase
MDYTAEDEVIIKEKWDDLLLSCTKICKNDEDWNFIKRAFFLAKEAHQGVRRRSGEPYLLHPIAVAKIVIEEIGLGVKSVVAALLHDVVEDTEYTVEDMERIFGPKIASMVDGLTKMSGVSNAEPRLLRCLHCKPNEFLETRWGFQDTATRTEDASCERDRVLL